MSLNWIVPGRRAVVTERVSYADVIAAWVAALREDELRRTLLDWYRPLSTAGAEMDSLYDETVTAIERWADTFFAEQSAERVHPHSAGEPAIINHEGFWLRLWKGPYRVVHEERAGIAADPADPGAVTLTSIEIDAGGTVVVRVDAHRRVLNPGATLLIGDVVELPVFRLMWRCGVRSFEGAHFNGAGSFLLGTSVVDGDGASPGRLRIHDNLAAMRFQAILNLARGAFYSLEPGLSGHLLDKSNHKTVDGQDLYARGVVYGGSLGSVSRRTSGVEAAYVFADNQWGVEGGANAPTKATLVQFAPGTRLTTAWSCTPCGMGLAKYMSATQGGSTYGGVNKTLRHRDATASLRENFDLNYFDSRMYGVTRDFGRDDALAYLFARAGGTGTPNVDFLREVALRELFGARAGRQVSEAQAAQDTESLVEAHDAAREAEEDVEAPHLREPTTTRELDLDYDEEASEELDDVVEELFDELEITGDEPLDWSLYLPPDEEIQLSRDELLAYFDGALNTVGLNGHEYTIVRIEKHARLLAEAGEGGPPVTGPLAAYNPLDGSSYHMAGEDEADLYIFEATGVVMPTRLGGALAISAFEMRPARWVRVESMYFKSNRQGRLYIGEGAAIGLTGRSHTRSKSLISVAKLSRARLDAIHSPARAHLPLSLQAHANELNHKTVVHDFPDRAVPFHTLAESNEDPQFATLAVANQTRRTLAGRLNRPAVRAAVTASVDASPRQITNRANQLRGQQLASVRHATQAVTRLRRQLGSRYAPDSGRTQEQPVEQRRSFRDALARFSVGARAVQGQVDAAQRRVETAVQRRHAAHQVVTTTTGQARRDARVQVQHWTTERDAARTELGARRRELGRLPGGPERELARQAAVLRSSDNAVEGVDWHARARTDLITTNVNRVVEIGRQLGR